MFPARMIDGARWRAREEEILSSLRVANRVSFLYSGQKVFLQGPGYHYTAEELRELAGAVDRMTEELNGDCNDDARRNQAGD